MLFEMGYYVQSVYVGGGDSRYGSEDKYVIMEYDISLKEWARLSMPRNQPSGFAMTVINNQLVQVGGERDGHKSRMVGMFIAESRRWMHPFPEMTTAAFTMLCSCVWQVVVCNRGLGWKRGDAVIR